MTIAELIQEAHETALARGWWEPRDGMPDRNFAEQVALMHSELSEALEEWRQPLTINGEHEQCDPFTTVYTNLWGAPCRLNTANELTPEKLNKPEGVAAELADVLIRIFDTCGKYNIPLEEALRAKMAYNKTRSYRHGGKLA